MLQKVAELNQIGQKLKPSKVLEESSEKPAVDAATADLTTISRRILWHLTPQNWPNGGVAQYKTNFW
jgi:hypothetical protein